MSELTLNDIAYRVAKHGRITRDEPRQEELDTIVADIRHLIPREAKGFDRARETPRRQQAVELLIAMGWTYDYELGWDRATHPAAQEAAKPVTSANDEPPQGLLVSMAMRLNHGFGGDDATSQKAQLADMRRCWEEVTGRGFYRAELDATYRSHLNPMQGAEKSAEDGQA